MGSLSLLTSLGRGLLDRLLDLLKSELVTPDAWQKGLQFVLRTLITGKDARGIRDQLEEQIRGKFSEQTGRSTARVLARSLCEQVDAAMELEIPGVTLEQQLEIGRTLGAHTAVAIARAADVYAAYPALQEAVVRLKRAGKPDSDPELIAARAERDAASRAVKEAMIDVGRVAAGDRPTGEL